MPRSTALISRRSDSGKEVRLKLSNYIIPLEKISRNGSDPLDNPLVQAHLTFRRMGWSTLPVREDKTPDAQLLPRDAFGQPHWSELRMRLPQADEVLRWGDAYGLGIVTGHHSGVVVIDLDPGYRSAVKGKHLPPTVMSHTPRGGCHLYFAHPGAQFRVRTAANILPHVDLRGDGGYAIEAPTTGYAWFPDMAPGEIPLAKLPEWLEPWLREESCASNKYSYLRREHPPGGVVLLHPTKGSDLVARASDPAFLPLAMNQLGIPNVTVGRAFRCILPGHNERSPSAALWRNPDTGEVRYHDFHRVEGEWYSLADVRAALGYGHVVTLSKSELVTWTTRLLVETGFVQSFTVPLPPLPAGSTLDTKKVYDGLRLLFGSRWLHTPGEPAPFTWKFARAWCGVPEHRAGAAIKVLIKREVIVKAGAHRRNGTGDEAPDKSGPRREMTLFLPGPVSR